MANTARKARKKAHRESGYSEATAFDPEPKRPTQKYRTHSQEQASRRRAREVAKVQDDFMRKVTNLPAVPLDAAGNPVA